jgi:hypothetical protein
MVFRSRECVADGIRVNGETRSRSCMRRLEGGNCAMRSACVTAESAFVMLSDVFPFEWMLLSWYVELAGSS